ncbi:MAG TPA: hypothetical protein VML57_04745 [Burkholderiales bacterium]|jgi:hypothetical protein|nr:hypothetical protein [Burkholderiales bacterium]
MSLALPPAVWMAHFLAVYVLVSLACPAGLEGLVRPGVAIATLAALAFFAAFGFAAWRGAGAPGETRAFIAYTNALVCALSAVGTLWVAAPAFMLAPCAS